MLGLKGAEVEGADIVEESNRQVTDHPSRHFTNQADGWSDKEVLDRTTRGMTTQSADRQNSCFTTQIATWPPSSCLTSDHPFETAAWLRISPSSCLTTQAMFEHLGSWSIVTSTWSLAGNHWLLTSLHPIIGSIQPHQRLDHPSSGRKTQIRCLSSQACGWEQEYSWKTTHVVVSN